jgi:hypothetical protein
MKVTKVRHHKVGGGISRIGVIGIAVMIGVFSLSFFYPRNGEAFFADTLCGEGSAPDYGFTYNLEQIHWTVNWQGDVLRETVVEVDAILDELNADSIAQTMILILNQDEVGNRVNCAVHFLRYMRLGLPTGERKDNGFAFLIVVEPTNVDVHYGVGLGLPALTAPELTSLNRLAEETYQSTGSLDQALLALVQEFDTVARNNYAPLDVPVPPPVAEEPFPFPASPLGILTLCGQVCLGLFIFFFLLWMFNQMARTGGTFIPSNWGPGSIGRSGPFDGGGSRPPPSRPSRGGSGSGRSGRGN